MLLLNIVSPRPDTRTHYTHTEAPIIIGNLLIHYS